VDENHVCTIVSSKIGMFDGGRRYVLLYNGGL